MKSGEPNLQIEFVINEVSRLLARIYHDEYRRVGLNPSMISALIYLQRSKDGLIQSELAENLEMGKAAAGTMIDKLEQKGLISRCSSDSDRRVRILEITQAGTAVVEEADTLTAHIRKAVRSITNKAERKQVIELLDRMRTCLKEIESSTKDAPKDTRQRGFRRL